MSLHRFIVSKHKTRIFLFGVLLFFSSIAMAQQQQSEAIHIVPATEFAQLLAHTPGVQLLDVRTMEEYAQSHVPGAMLIDWRDSSFVADAVRQLDKSQPVALYCRGGVRSHQAALALTASGFTNIIELEGGFTAWTNAGLEVAPTGNQ